MAVWMAISLGWIVGCGEPSLSPETLETIEVTPGLEIDTSEDQEARGVQAGLAGILPEDFPKDLPLYLPASLVDFGRSSEGRPSVNLLSPHGISRVRREIHELLRRDGWSTTSGNAGSIALKKNQRRARLYLEEGRPGTLYRYEY